MTLAQCSTANHSHLAPCDNAPQPGQCRASVAVTPKGSGSSFNSKDWNKKKGLATTFIAANPYVLAERTGLEPATPGVTGRYSNQLNYHSW